MTTLDTLGGAHPDLDEVADASLAMADFDAKRSDYAMALDWLAVAAHHRMLTPEYHEKKLAWSPPANQLPAAASPNSTQAAPAPAPLKEPRPPGGLASEPQRQHAHVVVWLLS